MYLTMRLSPQKNGLNVLGVLLGWLLFRPVSPHTSSGKTNMGSLTDTSGKLWPVCLQLEFWIQ